MMQETQQRKTQKEIQYHVNAVKSLVAEYRAAEQERVENRGLPGPWDNTMQEQKDRALNIAEFLKNQHGVVSGLHLPVSWSK